MEFLHLEKLYSLILLYYYFERIILSSVYIFLMHFWWLFYKTQLESLRRNDGLNCPINNLAIKEVIKTDKGQFHNIYLINLLKELLNMKYKYTGKVFLYDTTVWRKILWIEPFWNLFIFAHYLLWVMASWIVLRYNLD